VNDWTAFPHDSTAWRLDPVALQARWARLHAGDAEPWPQDEAVRQAWACFHAGEFRQAVELGLRAGGAGLAAAHKAQCIHAIYVEPDERRKLDLLLEVAERAAAQRAAQPQLASAHYWLAVALGRYAQSISVAQALAQGVGEKVKAALEATIALQPRHADAYIALGAFHAEVIDKAGARLARRQGSTRELALQMFATGLKLHPASVLGRIEYAQGLVMLEGERRLAEAEALYREAAACRPLDAMERLHVEVAREALEV